jgi:hypothetical protein
MDANGKANGMKDFFTHHPLSNLASSDGLRSVVKNDPDRSHVRNLLFLKPVFLVHQLAVFSQLSLPGAVTLPELASEGGLFIFMF